MKSRNTLNGWNISRTSGSLIYVTHNGEFVARFKYANPGKSATAFIKFLRANFTPEEYFAEIAKGKAPGDILAAKGFVSFNLRHLGSTLEEVNAAIARQIAERNARRPA